MSILTYNNENIYMVTDAVEDQVDNCHNSRSDAFELSGLNDSLETSEPQHHFPCIQWVDNESTNDEEFITRGSENEEFTKSGLPRWNARGSGLYRMDTFSSSSNTPSNTREDEDISRMPVVYGAASAALGRLPSSSYTQEWTDNIQLLDSHHHSWRHFVIPDLDQLMMNHHPTKSNLAY
mmetsp:Transcript_31221/g.30067  ORF Transcript_31221/g.30067 Transcript_31221/m.30067 type:complete len:179 (-) Transcript_31221:22-558(-)|eukprot:CAMPEP_0197831696 /NCGR_PEP_ID=MMETSP1437-20131217/11576_1 /TAXON_ID=49252 ORGANISM="Eucampia antarctica, Strain CCMP1452" /NCGR_SAMPLE_ID=MMETSP1437 /ASSEMBLY_ACC=CAM_ASM_001096 /LENGTH=178 /DNA_ID=CAMNT_0043434721 /DNA_START=48 /DNA_END=584 /DNA_ORIENTATION=+